MIADLARKILPDGARQGLSKLYYEQKIFKAARALSRSTKSPELLPEERFFEYLKKYPVSQRMQYDADSVLQRGNERATEVLEAVTQHGKGNFKNFLELGAGDGMVSTALRKQEKNASAIEFRLDDFDARATEAGVSLYKMDAADLKFEDESFDMVFSYNCYEHFPQPDKVFSESLRVLRKGGLMMIHFAPLYFSPWGVHAYNIIGIPYCHYLFDKGFMNKYIAENSTDKLVIDNTLNRWHVNQFRDVWNNKFKEQIAVKEYNEIKAPFFLDLVIAHPSCFKNKITSMDDLLVNEIFAVFEKR